MIARDIIANEKNFLGCLLRSPHDFWAVNGMVTADMFTSVPFRDIYSKIGDLLESGRQITSVALQAFLPKEYDPGGPTVAILATLKENAIDAGSAVDYAPFIAEQTARKRLGALSEWLRQEISKGDNSPEDVAADAAMRLQEIMATASPIKPVKLSEATARVLTASNVARERDVLPGFTTGLSGLDEMIGLLMGGDLIFVIGALGEGKSGLLTQIGHHIARSAPVLAAHNEMSLEQNATRAVASAAGMSVRQVREGAFDFSGYETIKEAQVGLEKLKYDLYINPKMTLRAIKSRALHMLRTTGLGAITVDAFKRLRTETKHRDKWDRYEELTGGLKEMAIELNVPILVAAQRTRTARRRDDPIPQLDDADAPTIETDSDICLGVWREESWLMMNKPNAKAGGEAWEEWEHKIRKARGIGKMIALKVRSGSPFEQREFKWNGPQTRFEDL
jgi:replicative DNA helicase